MMASPLVFLVFPLPTLPRKRGRVGRGTSRQSRPKHLRIVGSDLDDQLLQNGFGEALVAVRRNNDGARSADDVLKIVGVEIWLNREDRQPIDGDAVAHGLVTGHARRAADGVGAVAGYVDGAARSGERALRQDQPRIVDGAADRSAAAEQL